MRRLTLVPLLLAGCSTPTCPLGTRMSGSVCVADDDAAVQRDAWFTDAPADAGRPVDALPTMMIRVRVLVRRALGAQPLAGAHVRVETATAGAFEAESGTDGECELAVPVGSGPWTITAAHVETTSTMSILGVTDPEVGDVWLNGVWSDETPLAVGGTVSGAVGERHAVSGVGLRSGGGTGTTWTGELLDPGVPVRLLAVDWSPTPGSRPLNAVWFDLDVAAPSSNDIDFPSPPHGTIQGTLAAFLPATFPGFDAGSVLIRTDGSARHLVGVVTGEVLDGGRREISWEALDGDASPDILSFHWFDEAEPRHSAELTRPLARTGDAVIEPIDEAEATPGDLLSETTITVRAAGHECVGAVASGPGRGWWVWQCGDAPIVAAQWPAPPTAVPMVLPEGAVSLRFLGATFPGGTRPWRIESTTERTASTLLADAVVTYVAP